VREIFDALNFFALLFFCFFFFFLVSNGLDKKYLCWHSNRIQGSDDGGYEIFAQ